jgi:hypothetical protein
MPIAMLRALAITLWSPPLLMPNQLMMTEAEFNDSWRKTTDTPSVNPADEELLKMKNHYGENTLDSMRGFLIMETTHYMPKDFIVVCVKYCCCTAICDLDPKIQAEIQASLAAPPSSDMAF